jgi:hypothetical protein
MTLLKLEPAAAWAGSVSPRLFCNDLTSLLAWFDGLHNFIRISTLFRLCCILLSFLNQ